MKIRPKFTKNKETQFFDILQNRVNQYFKLNDLKKEGDIGLIAKSMVLLSILMLPYIIVLSFSPSILIAIPLLVLMGIGIAGVGMSVMHDALHGAFSSKKWVNNLFGSSIYLLGGNAINWKIQHNVLHHTYPNVYNVDEDVSTKGFVVRLSPQSRRRKIHAFQRFYSLPLYGLMTLSFMVKDFRQLARYNKTGETVRQGKKPVREMIKLIFTKATYLILIVGLPYIVTDYSILQIAIGFLIVHIVAGIITSTVFQLAHVVEHVEHPIVDKSGNIENSWAVHQLMTTSNFAPRSKFTHWFTGGLNHQVEHHLFPHISHIHYSKIAKIVEKTALEFGLPYNCEPTFWSALRSHLRTLTTLGGHKIRTELG
ncbi:MAG: acyl-CoA desaturase [Bacteroidetes bacterium]|nr:acyl-CoA desaturase [Bacteroidota bacterium]